MQTSRYRIEVRKPTDCPESELQEFVALVASGGEVVQGLEARVIRALCLAMLFCDDELVGSAAIKQPYASYRNKVFKNAGVFSLSKLYPIELGWIFIAPDHRGKKHTRPLTEAALKYKQGSVYATTRADNQAMQKVLDDLGFDRSGAAYRSNQHVGNEIFLYTRNTVAT